MYFLCAKSSLKSSIGCKDMLGSERIDSVRDKKVTGEDKHLLWLLSMGGWLVGASAQGVRAGGGQCTGFAGLVGASAQEAQHIASNCSFALVSLEFHYFHGNSDIKKPWILLAHIWHFFPSPCFLLQVPVGKHSWMLRLAGRILHPLWATVSPQRAGPCLSPTLWKRCRPSLPCQLTHT